MTTRFILVAIFSRKTLFFGDEAYSRRHFWVRNSFFGRREPFSSPFSAEKPYFPDFDSQKNKNSPKTAV
ncbi:hypothetical protein [Caldibacillus thermoamylovorans]|uniref:hypothetical protein n=1 Tax=Caldibacillus thermoamylovorans TaxID=35841 RepID=UPI001374B26A|nr:hypothetical protein [Caldibacillus thermoamylovorans]